MIQVKKCGYDSWHPKPFDIEHPNGLAHYLLLLIKTDAWYISNGQKTIIKPNSLILFDKEIYIHYGCDQSYYTDDWVHFAFTPDNESLIHTLGIPFNTPLPISDTKRLSSYIQLISREFYFQSENSGEIINHLLHAFLFTLPIEIQQSAIPDIPHKLYPDFLQLRNTIYSNPAQHYNSEQLARCLNLSVSRFQHLYKIFFSITPQNDIICARVKYAKFYLRNTNMSICSIASFCGYESEEHFMRQFKKNAGMTPTEFRYKKNK